jgi:hypothetical protein
VPVFAITMTYAPSDIADEAAPPALGMQKIIRIKS